MSEMAWGRTPKRHSGYNDKTQRIKWVENQPNRNDNEIINTSQQKSKLRIC